MQDNAELVNMIRRYLKENPKNRTADKMPMSLKAYVELESLANYCSVSKQDLALDFIFDKQHFYKGYSLGEYYWGFTSFEIFPHIIHSLMLVNSSAYEDLEESYLNDNYFIRSEKVWKSALKIPLSIDFFVDIVETGQNKISTLKEWRNNDYDFHMICDFISCSPNLTKDFISKYIDFLNLYLLKKNNKI